VDKYEYINDPPRKRLLKAVAVGIGAGAILGAIHLWQVEMSWKGFVTGVCAGTIGGGVFGLALGQSHSRSRITVYLAAGVAGAVAGAVWWAGVRPDSSVAVCAVAGALIVPIVFALTEFGIHLT
jgi:hypothetical protein